MDYFLGADEEEYDYEFEEGYTIHSSEQAPEQQHVMNQVIQEESSSDDGWASDSCEDQAQLSQNLLDDMLIERVRGQWLRAGKRCSDEISVTLKEGFAAHPSVIELVTCFLERTGSRTSPRRSIQWIVADEFLKWRKAEGSDQSYECSNTHHMRALVVLEHSHSSLFDNLCEIFDLKTVDRSKLLGLIRTLLDNYQHNEAVMYALKLGLQRDLDLKEMVLPLIVMDKINMIELYLEEDCQVQKQFLTLLDEMCRPYFNLDLIRSYLAHQGIHGKDNSKLHPQHLEKLGLRLAGNYAIPLSEFPYLFKRKASSSLHHLLQMKYAEGMVEDDNFKDLLDAVMVNQPSLQSQLLKELVSYNDLSLAAKCAQDYSIPFSSLPSNLQIHIASSALSSTSITGHDKTQSCQKSKLEADSSTRKLGKQRLPNSTRECYHQLVLPDECIVHVNDLASFKRCQNAILKPGTVVGIDSEWRMPVCNGGLERVALLQLAIHSNVFLLHMTSLTQSVSENTLKQFAHDLFSSESILKLGFQFDSDLSMLAKTWRFAAADLLSPKNVMDTKRFIDLIDLLPSEHSSPPHTTRASPPLRGSHTPPTSGHMTVLPPHQLFVHFGLPTTPASPPCPTDSHSSSKDASNQLPAAIGPVSRGLSWLVERCLGKPLNKSQQISDWEKRPLKPEQVHYAALDAYCLLEVYGYMRSRARALPPSFRVDPASIPPPQ